MERRFCGGTWLWPPRCAVAFVKLFIVSPESRN